MKIKELIQFDLALKTILRDKVNFPILEGFLSELLHTDVTIESLLESEPNKENAKEKPSHIDVFAQLASGEKVIIEVQCLHDRNFLPQMLYGASQVVVKYCEGDSNYHELVSRVIAVNIIYFNLSCGADYIYHGSNEFKGMKKHYTLHLRENEKKHCPDFCIEYYLLEVKAFDLTIRNTLDEWMYMLKQSEVKPEFKAKGIQQAAKILYY